MKTIWDLTKWLGRVSLWVVFTPAGMWRSVRHGRLKRHRELIQALEDLNDASAASVRTEPNRG